MVKHRRDYKNEVKVWAKRIGVREAERNLVIAGVSTAVAYRLARGCYKSNPKQDTCDAIEDALAGVGSDKAS